MVWVHCSTMPTTSQDSGREGVFLFSPNSPSLAQVLAHRTDRICMSKRESGIRTCQEKGIPGTKALSLCVCLDTSDWSTGKCQGLLETEIRKEFWGQTVKILYVVLVGLVFFQHWGVIEKVQSGSSTEFGG